jgi:uncharacterized protein (TIGR02588 family)
MPSRRETSRPDHSVPRLEWIAAGFGLLLVTVTISFMLYQAFGGEAHPPSIDLKVESIQQVVNGHVVVFKAVNVGQTTAAEVTIEGTLHDRGASVETTQTTFQYLPPRSERQAGLFFVRDPQKFKLEIRPKGYRAP